MQTKTSENRQQKDEIFMYISEIASSIEFCTCCSGIGNLLLEWELCLVCLNRFHFQFIMASVVCHRRESTSVKLSVSKEKFRFGSLGTQILSTTRT